MSIAILPVLLSLLFGTIQNLLTQILFMASIMGLIIGLAAYREARSSNMLYAS